MERADHPLEFVHLFAPRAAARVLVVRGEEADRVVAPVVAEAHLDKALVVDELVHGHQLDRRDAERFQVLDHGGMSQPGVRAAQLLGHLGMESRHPFDVSLVDHRFVQRRVGMAVAGPVEMRMLHDRAVDVRRAVLVVARRLVAEVVRVARGVPAHLALDRAGVRIQEKLVRVAADAVLGRVRPVNPVAVSLAGADVRHVRVPGEGVDLVEGDPLLRAVLVEKAQLDLLRDLAEEREIRSGAVVRRAKWKGAAWPYLDLSCRVSQWGFQFRRLPSPGAGSRRLRRTLRRAGSTWRAAIPRAARPSSRRRRGSRPR